MSKKLFTNKEIKILSKNPYIKAISERGITYTDEFKRIFISEYEQGNPTAKIFKNHGFDGDLLGKQRIISSGKRWRKIYKDKGLTGLNERRKNNSGRPSEKNLSLEENYKKMEVQNNLLKAENELLKNIVTYLFTLSGVSRSGYYNYISPEAKSRRDKCAERDKVLKDKINDYMDYYNNFRYQWNLKR